LWSLPTATERAAQTARAVQPIGVAAQTEAPSFKLNNSSLWAWMFFANDTERVASIATRERARVNV
jgi:hypothetical protein